MKAQTNYLRRLCAAALCVSLSVIGANVAVAQQKIDCSKMKFSISLPFQECTVETTASKTIDAYIGRGHDASSSYNVGMYVMLPRTGYLQVTRQEQLLEGSSDTTHQRLHIYKEFFARTPSRSSRSEEGPWLRFDATVLRPDGSAIMNCLQFSRQEAPAKWILFGSLCVKDGKVPTNAADLVLQSLQLNNQ